LAVAVVQAVAVVDLMVVAIRTHLAVDQRSLRGHMDPVGVTRLVRHHHRRLVAVYVLRGVSRACVDSCSWPQ